MRRQRLLQWILKLTYLYSLVIGLCPAPLDWQNMKFQSSRIYLIYSACMLVLCVVAIPYIYPYYVYEGTYMYEKLVLQWTNNVTNCIKILVVIFLSKDLWCKRQHIMETFQMYCQMVRRYRLFQCDEGITGNKDEYRQITQRIERYMIYKFIASCANMLLSAAILFVMQNSREFEYEYVLMVLINFLLSSFSLTAEGQFFCMLCELNRQFEYVNIALDDLSHFNPNKDAVNVGQEADKLSVRFNTLAAMHFDCYRLTLRVFSMCQTSSAAITFKVFVRNVNIVYHAVLFTNGTIAADAWARLNGCLLMIVYYWDVGLLFAVIEGVLSSCNGTGNLLRCKSSELLEWQAQFECLKRALDQFADQLRCHKLAFKICGLFELNMEASLRYFFYVFVQVTVMVQFDLSLNNAKNASPI